MEVTVKTAKAILVKIAQKQLAGGKPQPVMMWGPPGIGKSDIVKAVTRECGIELRDVRLSQLDPVDLRGVPTVEDGQTKWATPNFFPTDQDSAGIFFLDELSAADCRGGGQPRRGQCGLVAHVVGVGEPDDAPRTSRRT